MELIIHRVNKISELKCTDSRYGTEIDIRSWGSDLILNHESFAVGERLVNYLDEYQHGTLILNIKEAGIEDEVLRLVKERPLISSYFLLDVEFPYLYRASRLGERNVAIRFSEVESIKTVSNFVGKLDWVWIDTISELPVNLKNKPILDQFRKCLVCPERWGRPQDIAYCKATLQKLKFTCNAVMTSVKYIEKWSL